MPDFYVEVPLFSKVLVIGAEDTDDAVRFAIQKVKSEIKTAAIEYDDFGEDFDVWECKKEENYHLISRA